MFSGTSRLELVPFRDITEVIANKTNVVKWAREPASENHPSLSGGEVEKRKTPKCIHMRDSAEG